VSIRAHQILVANFIRLQIAREAVKSEYHIYDVSFSGFVSFLGALIHQSAGMQMGKIVYIPTVLER
jgi:hypothetical protein